MLYVISQVLQKVKGFFRPIILVALSILILMGCGGPPQFPAEGQETPAVLALDASSTVTFIDRITNQPFIFSIQINNQSYSVPADSIAVISDPSSPYSYTGGSFPGAGGTCSTSLAEGQSCLVELQINATVAGQYDSPLVLSYFDGLADQTLTVPLSTQVRDPYPAQLVLSPAGDFDFGITALGGFVDIPMTLQNTGEMPATALTLSGFSDPFSVLNSTCGVTVDGGDSCDLTLRFAPSAAAVFHQSLNINYNDGVAPQVMSRTLTGEGRVAGFIAVDGGNSIDYGVILGGRSSERVLTLRNTGGGNASTVGLTGLVAPYSLVSSNCPATLIPSQTCQATVRFSPTLTAASADQLEINYSDGFNNQTTVVNLQGQGFNDNFTLSLLTPASSPSQEATPTFRVANVVSGLTVRLYNGATCASELINGVSTGNQFDASPTLAEGDYQVHGRVEDSDGHLSTCSASSVAYTYDNTPPQPPANVIFTQSYTSSSTTSPTILWNASSSPDVVDYQVGVSTSAAGGNSHGGFTSKGNVTSAIESGLSMVECQYYYASVQAIDHVALTSLTHAVSATPFRYDSAIPSAPTNLSEGGDGSLNNSATVTWTASTDACGISHYEVAVSEDTNGNNTLDASEIGNAVAFSDVGNITSHRFDAITLTNGVTHFTSIRAVDTTGRPSSASVSDPWIVYDPSIELPDMIVWLDGNDPATIEDSNNRNALDPLFNGQVDRWLDKSGSAATHNFTDSAARPTFNGTNMSVQFDGASTGMTTGDHPDINTATVLQRNITVAFRTSGDIGSRQILYEEGGNIRGMNVYIFNNQLYCGFYNTPNDGDDPQAFTWVSTPIAVNQTYFVTWVFDYTNYAGPAGPDGDLTCYVNNASIGSVPSTSRLFAHSGDVGLGHVDNQSCFEDGSCTNSGSHFLGEIYEVMLFNNAPSGTDVTNVHTYLDNKWN